ncbi:MAG: hypothetical protein U1A77_14055 [Pirellulales bacterium]
MNDTQAARVSLSLDAINFGDIPRDLVDVNRWVMWRSVEREGKATKVPFEPSGRHASSTDSTTWTSFDVARTAYDRGGFSGVGFVLTKDGGFVGVDLDGCRNPDTGDVAKWASDIVDACGGTYAEISPSRTGIKLYARGSSPITGKNKAQISDEPPCGGKLAGIEVYDSGRYFAVTGWRLPNSNREPCEILPEGWDAIRRLLLPPAKAAPSSVTVSTAAPTTVDIVERAWRYLEKMPDSIAGQRGHDAMFAAACKTFEFGLTDQQAAEVLSRFNASKCNPTWSDRELEHKLQSARAAVERERRS